MATGDLATKLRLERKLSAKMRSLFGSIGRTLQPTVGSPAPNLVTVWQPVLASTLLSHYALVSNAFVRPLVRSLPAEARPGEKESRVIAIRLGRVFSARAAGQAKIILETAQARVGTSVGRAAAAIAAPNSGLTAADLPRVAVRHWLRRQVVQSRAVATVETQTAAETSKGVVVAALLGYHQPVRKAVVGEPSKVWTTQGDSKVRGADGKGRFDHFDADGQRVPISQPFTVSGEQLKWPGDWSLGASGGNIYGCRCSAQYEVDSIAELRAILGQRIAVDVERFPQTESDVVVSLPFTL